MTDRVTIPAEKIFDIKAVWNTDGGGMGQKTNLIGLFTENAPDGPFMIQEDRRAVIIDETVYLLDLHIGGLPIDRINMNLPKKDAEDRKTALAKLTDREKALLGIKL